MQGKHVRVLIDDAAGGAEQRGGATDFGFQFVRFGSGDHAHALDLVALRALEQGQEHLLLFIAVGDDEFAAVLMIHASLPAIFVQARCGHAESALKLPGV